MVKKIGRLFMRLALYKLICSVDIAFYQSIILLYCRVFIRYEKNLVNGLIGHQVLSEILYFRIVVIIRVVKLTIFPFRCISCSSCLKKA
jgi:hypothetical protein